MSLATSNQFGEVYEFGLEDADAPVIAGMRVTRLENKYEPEVWETAQTGEGKVDSVTTDKPDQRMATSTVTGNISDIDAYLTATEKFTFRSRMYIIRSVSEPRTNGKYVEGTVEATSYFLVDSGPF